MAFLQSADLVNSTERLAKPFPRPWRGTLVIHGLQSEGNEMPQGLIATAVETDGNTRSDLWPSSFVVQSAQQRSILSEVHEWARQNAPPLCTFVPDRLRNPDNDAINQILYQRLCRQLLQNKTVATALWDAPDRLPGAGIIIYPAQYKSAILAGAIFLTEPFPDFISYAPMSPPLHSPISDSSVAHLPYQHSLEFSPSFASTSQHHYLHHSSSLPAISFSGEHPSQGYPRNRVYATEQLVGDPYQGGTYIIPSTSYTYAAAPSGVHAWSTDNVDDRDDLDLSEFSSGVAGGHRRSHFPQ